MGLYDFFSRVLVPVRQRPSSTDLNRLQQYLEAGLRVLHANALGSAISGDPATAYGTLGTAAPGNGFHGTGFRVVANGAYDILLYPGFGYGITGPASATDIDSTSGTDWTASTIFGAPIVLSALEALVVPAAPVAGSSRIDIIEVRPDYLAASPATVGIFNAATRVFDPTVKNKRLHWDLSGRTGSVNAPAASTAPISYVRGVSAVGGIAAASEPAGTSGYITIARINLDNNVGVPAITQDLIADMRPKLYAGGIIHAGGRVTIPGTAAGLAAAAVTTLELPPGVNAVLTFANNVPPAAGTSYEGVIYLFGAGIIPRTVMSSARGAPTISPLGSVGPRTVDIVSSGTGVLTVASQAIVAGLDATWTTINPSLRAVGQPYYKFHFKVQHPAAAALAANEAVMFNVSLGQG